MVTVCESTDSELAVINGVGTACGIPIYTPQYFECAVSRQTDDFPVREFGLLCIQLAVRNDVVIRKDQFFRPLPSGRRRQRKEVRENAGSCTFENGCPDKSYRALFSECFVPVGDEMCWNLNLEQFVCEKKQAARSKMGKRFVLYKRGFGIHKHRRRRLLVLMRIYHKFLVWGVHHLQTVSPPWFPGNACTINLTSE
tara:strand:+ start:60 stop:650 length:591 start_codon:yes stop_codon:yes gene_type:complete